VALSYFAHVYLLALGGSYSLSTPVTGGGATENPTGGSMSVVVPLDPVSTASAPDAVSGGGGHYDVGAPHAASAAGYASSAPGYTEPHGENVS
jgi:hypothetical protein